jgi:hypothetical protein
MNSDTSKNSSESRELCQYIYDQYYRGFSEYLKLSEQSGFDLGSRLVLQIREQYPTLTLSSDLTFSLSRLLSKAPEEVARGVVQEFESSPTVFPKIEAGGFLNTVAEVSETAAVSWRLRPVVSRPKISVYIPERTESISRLNYERLQAFVRLFIRLRANAGYQTDLVTWSGKSWKGESQNEAEQKLFVFGSHQLSKSEFRNFRSQAGSDAEISLIDHLAQLDESSYLPDSSMTNDIDWSIYLAECSNSAAFDLEAWNLADHSCLRLYLGRSLKRLLQVLDMSEVREEGLKDGPLSLMPDSVQAPLLALPFYYEQALFRPEYVGVFLAGVRKLLWEFNFWFNSPTTRQQLLQANALEAGQLREILASFTGLFSSILGALEEEQK